MSATLNSSNDLALICSGSSVDSKKVSKEFLAKISEFPNDKKEKAIEKYWERRNDEMSKLNAKGIK